MLSEKPWKLESLLRLALGILLCVFASGVALAATQRLGGAALVDSPWRAVVSAVGFQGAALVFVHLFIREHHLTWAEAFGFCNHWRRAVVIGIIATLIFLPVGLALMWAVAGLLDALGHAPEEQAAVQAFRDADNLSVTIGLAIVAVVLAPVAEEILFRGVLYPWVKRLGFPNLALWGNSMLFAMIHWNLPTFLALLVLALMLTTLYEKTDNLLAPIAAHVCFNAINLIFFFVFQHFEATAPLQQ